MRDETGSFADCLTALFNTFAQRGLPAVWNQLHITSLFKSGDPVDPTNYRPISVM